MKKEKLKIVNYQIVAILLLYIIYYSFVSKVYAYSGFQFEFNIEKTILSNVILVIFLGLSITVKKGLINFLWNSIYILQLVPECIFYQFNEAKITQIVSISLVLTLLIPISYSKLRLKSIKFNKEKFTVLSIISFILIIPSIVIYYNKVNLWNLLLIDVYKTRLLFRDIGNSIIGYINTPLSRVILPILIINSITKKDYKKALVFISMIVYIYLLGAQKSIFIGLIALLLFYKGDYYYKLKFLLKGLIILFTVGLFLFFSLDNLILLSVFVRRVFFIPPLMNSTYNIYFENNFTYLSHSPFGLGYVEDKYESLSMFVGEKVLNSPNMNANVGIYTEGYFSFGYLGVIIFAILIVVILYFFYFINISDKYFGILFTYLIYLNSSFLSTLLLTHGLFLFMIISILFLNDNDELIGDSG